MNGRVAPFIGKFTKCVRIVITTVNKLDKLEYMCKYHDLSYSMCELHCLSWQLVFVSYLVPSYNPLLNDKLSFVTDGDLW